MTHYVRDSVARGARAVRTLPVEIRTATPPIPRIAKIELSSRCDLACRFCASSRRDSRPHGDMSLPLFAHLMPRLRRLGVEELGLFYIGESFLCAWLPDAIRFAKAAGFRRLFVTTNGVSAMPARVRACMEAGLDSLKFALNWADATQFRQLTGAGADTYETVLANIIAACAVRDRVAAETGHRCALAASSLVYDNEQVERMEPVLRRVTPYVDEHYWLPLYGRACSAIAGGATERRKPVPCPALFTELHVTHDGRISACSLDASPRFEVSGLESGSIACGWLSPRFRALRQAHLDGDVSGTVCAHCIGYEEA